MAQPAPAREGRKRKWDVTDESVQNPLPSIPNISGIAAMLQHQVANAASIETIRAAQEAAARVQQMLANKGKKEEAQHVMEIDINDSPNRFVLTRGSTHEDIRRATGAVVITRGKYCPPGTISPNPDGERPLYLHVSADSQEILDKAAKMIYDMMNRGGGREKSAHYQPHPSYGQPTTKIFVGIEQDGEFDVVSKIRGPQGAYLQHIMKETAAQIYVKGRGSGYIDVATKQESPEPLHLWLAAATIPQLDNAKSLAHNLLLTVRQQFDHFNAQKRPPMPPYGQYAPPPYPLPPNTYGAPYYRPPPPLPPGPTPPLDSHPAAGPSHPAPSGPYASPPPPYGFPPHGAPPPPAGPYASASPPAPLYPPYPPPAAGSPAPPPQPPMRNPATDSSTAASSGAGEGRYTPTSGPPYGAYNYPLPGPPPPSQYNLPYGPPPPFYPAHMPPTDLPVHAAAAQRPGPHQAEHPMHYPPLPPLYPHQDHQQDVGPAPGPQLPGPDDELHEYPSAPPPPRPASPSPPPRQPFKEPPPPRSPALNSHPPSSSGDHMPPPPPPANKPPASVSSSSIAPLGPPPPRPAASALVDAACSKPKPATSSAASAPSHPNHTSSSTASPRHPNHTSLPPTPPPPPPARKPQSSNSTASSSQRAPQPSSAKPSSVKLVDYGDDDDDDDDHQDDLDHHTNSTASLSSAAAPSSNSTPQPAKSSALPFWAAPSAGAAAGAGPGEEYKEMLVQLGVQGNRIGKDMAIGIAKSMLVSPKEPSKDDTWKVRHLS